MSDSAADACALCSQPSKRRPVWAPWRTARPCGRCGKPLCWKCKSKLALIPEGQPLKASEVKTFCRSCFEATSTVDFAAPQVDVPAAEGAGRGDLLVWVHGGGSSRQLMVWHAQELAAQGFRSVLVDLPAHASRAEEDLSLESAEKVVLDATRERVGEGERAVYVGASLGGYLGFAVLGRNPEVFKAAVIMDAGQNVGPGASLKARLGLSAMNTVLPMMSGEKLMKTFVGLSSKSKTMDEPLMVRTSFGAGFFFDKGAQQVALLRAIAPATFLPKITCPILFQNGAKDYRDSEARWLELSASPASEIKCYPGDHFFMHDQALKHDVVADIVAFLRRVLPADPSSESTAAVASAT